MSTLRPLETRTNAPPHLGASGLLAALLTWLVVSIAGCASGPPGSPALPGGRDGAEANPPAGLANVPDAEPRLEPIRAGGPNKPYEVLGRNYVPETRDAPFTESGMASWYGRKFHGRRTASGEVYNMYAMTAAHPTLPLPSYARIRNPANGREVLVRVNDRGPFHPGRIVDLSYTAALKLDLLRGAAMVELQRITFDEIRAGTWRRDAGDTRVAAAAAPEATPALTSAAIPAIPAIPAAATGTATSSPSVPGVSLVAFESPAADPPAPAPQPIADAPSVRALTPPARGFWVQLGAFKSPGGAEAFHQQVSANMAWLSPLLAVFGEGSMYRLQAGPYPSRDEARSVAERVRSGFKLVPAIVERR